MSAEAAANRDRMIVEAMRAGMTRSEASVLTDVSKHAFDEAMGTAQRILDTCPPHLRLPAFASVLASFATVLREKLPEQWAAYCATDIKPEESAVIIMGGSSDGTR